MRNHTWFAEVLVFDVPLSFFRKLTRLVFPGFVSYRSKASPAKETLGSNVARQIAANLT